MVMLEENVFAAPSGRMAVDSPQPYAESSSKVSANGQEVFIWFRDNASLGSFC